jgi:hypothetical protein
MLRGADDELKTGYWKAWRFRVKGVIIFLSSFDVDLS